MREDSFHTERSGENVSPLEKIGLDNRLSPPDTSLFKELLIGEERTLLFEDQKTTFEPVLWADSAHNGSAHNGSAHNGSLILGVRAKNDELFLPVISPAPSHSGTDLIASLRAFRLLERSLERIQELEAPSFREGIAAVMESCWYASMPTGDEHTFRVARETLLSHLSEEELLQADRLPTAQVDTILQNAKAAGWTLAPISLFAELNLGSIAPNRGVVLFIHSHFEELEQHAAFMALALSDPFGDESWEDLLLANLPGDGKTFVEKHWDEVQTYFQHTLHFLFNDLPEIVQSLSSSLTDCIELGEQHGIIREKQSTADNLTQLLAFPTHESRLAEGAKTILRALSTLEDLGRGPALPWELPSDMPGEQGDELVRQFVLSPHQALEDIFFSLSRLQVYLADRQAIAALEGSSQEERFARLLTQVSKASDQLERSVKERFQNFYVIS